MAFIKENKVFHKTVLSDLQGAWVNLREDVVENHPFQDSDRLLFQIDEAMSWEAVRDLEYMQKLSVLIRNIAIKSNSPQDVLNSIEQVHYSFKEVFDAIASGESV